MTPIYDDAEDIPRDRETGAPLLFGQRLLAHATLTESDTDEVVSETLVMPNLIVHYEQFAGDARFGEHIMCTPTYARTFIREVLPAKAAKFDTCECEWHEAHHLTLEVYE